MANSDRQRRLVVVGHSASGQSFGAERSLLDILASIDTDRFDTTCILPLAPEISHEPEYVRQIRQTTKLLTFDYHWSTKGSAREEAIQRFARVFETAGTELVHVNTVTLAEPLLAARRCGVRSIVHVRELIVEDPALAEVLGSNPGTIIDDISDTTDFVIANSLATARMFAKSKNFIKIYNCVDVDRFSIPNHIESGRLKIGIISSNSERKGLREFVEIAQAARRAYPTFEFVVIGPLNALTAELQEAQSQRPDRANLTFLGYLDDPVDAISRLNVVMSLSRVPESFGRTLVEAMAAGRPIVANAHGATTELVRHGIDGFLFPSTERWCALDYLARLADDPREVERIGRNGRARAKALFSREVFRRDLNQAYEAFLSRPLKN